MGLVVLSAQLIQLTVTGPGSSELAIASPASTIEAAHRLREDPRDDG